MVLQTIITLYLRLRSERFRLDFEILKNVRKLNIFLIKLQVVLITKI